MEELVVIDEAAAEDERVTVAVESDDGDEVGDEVKEGSKDGDDSIDEMMSEVGSEADEEKEDGVMGSEEGLGKVSENVSRAGVGEICETADETADSSGLVSDVCMDGASCARVGE